MHPNVPRGGRSSIAYWRRNGYPFLPFLDIIMRDIGSSSMGKCESSKVVFAGVTSAEGDVTFVEGKLGNV